MPSRPALRRLAVQPGWVLLPLRLFLGVTFAYAGLQKLADRNWLDPHAPSGFAAQLHAYARHSPVAGLLHVAGHVAWPVGVLIALAELGVGLGALLGLWTRVAAAGGAALSLAFLLGVSWHTHPFYLSPDVFSLAAWVPLLVAGDGGVWSVDAVLRARARRELRLGPAGSVAIDFATVRQLCGAFQAGACARRGGAACAPGPCPVLAAVPAPRPDVARELDRRTFLGRAGVAGWVAAGAAATGGVVALVGRVLAPTRRVTTAGQALADASPTSPTTTTTLAPPPRPAPPAAARSAGSARSAPSAPARPAGTRIGPASSVPLGGAAFFTDPASGDPAWVVQPTRGEYIAHDAVCTHQGCTVRYRQGGVFVCPCHGAAFDARNGAPLRGPAFDPLPAIKVTLGPDGQLYVDG